MDLLLPAKPTVIVTVMATVNVKCKWCSCWVQVSVNAGHICLKEISPDTMFIITVSFLSFRHGREFYE